MERMRLGRVQVLIPPRSAITLTLSIGNLYGGSMDKALLIIFRDEKFERAIRIPSRIVRDL